MSQVFSKSDVSSLNLILQAMNEARREKKVMSPGEIKVLIRERSKDNSIQWIARVENALREADTKLFSYGSLQPGRQNAHMLQDITGHWHDGFVYGDITFSGWGTAIGFPVLTPDYTAMRPKVFGKLFNARALARHWNVLDEFEGEDYIRLLTLVYTENPQGITIANVYAGSGK